MYDLIRDWTSFLKGMDIFKNQHMVKMDDDYYESAR